MTTRQKPKRRVKPAKRQGAEVLRPDVAAAIERAWPDGDAEMPFELEECWFWEQHPILAGIFRHIEAASLLYERDAEPTAVLDGLG